MDIANILLSLDQKDFRILGAIERLMITQEFPRVMEIPKETGYSNKYIQKRLKNLHENDLIQIKRKEGEYYEANLNFNGYDILAFNALVKGGMISGIGQKIGVGKESEIYLVQNDSKKVGIIKIHRLGKGNFRSYKKNRKYLAVKHHSSDIYNSRLSAQYESSILKKVEGSIPVPSLWGKNRHCLVMNYIDGVDLYRSDLESKRHFQYLFDKLLQIITELVNIGIVHGDFSPYNIMVTYDQVLDLYQPWIIDWPQAISLDHPNAKDSLFMDITNLIEYFAKKIDLANISVEKIVNDLIN